MHERLLAMIRSRRDTGFRVAVTDAVFEITVPLATPAPTFTTSVNVGALPFVTVASVAVIVPVAPTSGVVTLHPAGAVNDTNVVFAGTTSLRLTVVASLGPLFVAVSE